ncbi:MAG: asparagine synthetase A [Alphaproteobacteria bacterium]
MTVRQKHAVDEFSSPSFGPPDSWRAPDRHLDALLNDPWYGGMMRLFGTLSQASHDFFREEGGVAIFAPVTTGSISSPMGYGSDSLPVQAEIDGHSVYLADSMQFSLELALRVVGRPVYYIMPSFRGEASDDRHLNQFVHAEAEIEGGLDDVMALIERYVRTLSRTLLDDGSDDVAAMGGNADSLTRLAAADGALPRITFAEAERRLQDRPNMLERCETGDNRITGAGERALIKDAGGPVWITHMPARTVPFYQAVSPDNPEESMSADLLMGIGETIGAGERAHTLEDVEENLRAANVDGRDYDWYLEMKALRPMKTSGFGLGMERFLMWATNTNDIRNWAFLLRNEYGEGSP